MPNAMKTAYLVQPGNVEIREVPEPRPGDGELVVKVECALTCGTDLKAYRRGHPLIPMPGPFGHQWTGTVAQVGPGLPQFEPGAPLLGVNSGPCMQCRPCRRGRYSLCRWLSENLLLGAFGQYLRVPRPVAEHNVLPRPEGMDRVRGAFLEPVSCVVHGLRQIQWKGVERVLILGLGSMGLLFARLIPKFATVSAVGVGRGGQRLALAGRSGLEQVLDVDAEATLPALAEMEGFDCVIECTGRPEGWQIAFDSAEPGAQVEFFGGLPKGTRFEVDTYRMHYEELRLIGSFHFGPSDVRLAAELLESDGLVVEDLVSGTLPLEKLQQALCDMAESTAIKYAIDPWM
jgi:L-iditol 2-dehydrogenase